MNKIINSPFIFLIELYQQYVSPHKGYCCAHSALHGKSSCSSWAIHILKRDTLISFFPLMKRRFKACQLAFEKIEKDKKHKKVKGDAYKCPCGSNIDTAVCCVSTVPFPCV